MDPSVVWPLPTDTQTPTFVEKYTFKIATPAAREETERGPAYAPRQGAMLSARLQSKPLQFGKESATTAGVNVTPAHNNAQVVPRNTEKVRGEGTSRCFSGRPGGCGETNSLKVLRLPD